MVLIVARDAVAEVMASVRAAGESVYEIGSLKARADGEAQVIIEHLTEAFAK
jgi:phosphoribosylaminoimidazole (AIR) synthetase